MAVFLKKRGRTVPTMGLLTVGVHRVFWRRYVVLAAVNITIVCSRVGDAYRLGDKKINMCFFENL
jgi:hypothetical protein